MWKEGMRPILKSLQSVRLGRVLARKEAGQQCVTAGVMTHRRVWRTNVFAWFRSRALKID